MKHSIDYVSPLAATDKPQPVNFDRLTDDELELLEVLYAKLEGKKARGDGPSQVLVLTFGPDEYLMTQPGSDHKYRVKQIRLESAPNPDAQPTIGLPTAGQGDGDSDLRKTTPDTEGRATD